VLDKAARANGGRRKHLTVREVSGEALRSHGHSCDRASGSL
jgi:hypothetical protein